MSSIILSSYFTKKAHPNHPQDTSVVGRMPNMHVKNNSFTYIKDWYLSIEKNNLNAVLFHDDLSNDFVDKYQTSKIKFQKVKDSIWSNLDYRWFCYRDFLKNNKFDSVFMTDCSDVRIVKDPGPLIKEFPEKDYFLCKDSLMLDQFPYISFHKSHQLDNSFWFMMNHNKLELINMGVVGGSYKKILEFLNEYTETRKKIKNPEFSSADMYLSQYVFRNPSSNKKLLIGEPVCSEFKKYESDREDVYFIHK